MIGVPYFIFIMFCLTAYRGTRELCFYCKFPIAVNFIVLALMILLYIDFPKWYFIITGIIFVIIVLLKGAKNEELRKEREKRKKQVEDDRATLFDKANEMKNQ